MTPDQVRSLLLAAKPSRYAPLFELLVNTGLRRGEALALHWSDLDFDEKLLRVGGTLARVAGELVVTETRRRGLAELTAPRPMGSDVATAICLAPRSNDRCE